MVKLIINLLLIFFFLTPSLTQAQTLIEKATRAAHQPSRSSTSKSHHHDYHHDRNSGYTSSVHILENSTIFYKNRFAISDFWEWLNIYKETKAYEWILQEYRNGNIGPYAEVVAPNGLQLYSHTFRQGSSITFKKVFSIIQHSVSGSDLITHLKKIGVLNDAGYLIGFDEKKINTSLSDFQYLFTKITTLPSDINNKNVASILKRDLIFLIGTLSQERLITQKETIRYESRKDGLLANVLDMAMGTTAAKFAFKDKINQSRNRIQWNSSLNPSNHYTNIYSSFTPYPYYKNHRSPISLFGKSLFSEFTGTYATDKNDTSYLDLNLQWNSNFRQETELEKVSHAGVYLNFTQPLKEKNDSLNISKIGFNAGQIGQTYSLQAGGGLGYVKEPKDSYLGVVISTSGRYYTPVPLSLGAQWSSITGGELIEDPHSGNTNNWSYSQLSLDITAHIKHFSIRTGYIWSFSKTTKIFEGMFFGGAVSF